MSIAFMKMAKKPFKTFQPLLFIHKATEVDQCFFGRQQYEDINSYEITSYGFFKVGFHCNYLKRELTAGTPE